MTKEVELKLRVPSSLIEETSPAVLFELAIEPSAKLHLHPEIVSKAERGYALADDSFAEPVKATGSPVAKDISLPHY